MVGRELSTKGQNGYFGDDTNTLYLDYGYLAVLILFSKLTLH